MESLAWALFMEYLIQYWLRQAVVKSKDEGESEYVIWNWNTIKSEDDYFNKFIRKLIKVVGNNLKFTKSLKCTNNLALIDQLPWFIFKETLFIAIFVVDFFTAPSVTTKLSHISFGMFQLSVELFHFLTKKIKHLITLIFFITTLLLCFSYFILLSYFWI